MNIVYSVFYAGAVVVLTVEEMKQEVVTEWQLKDFLYRNVLLELVSVLNH
jgi:hypothetical protein